MSREDKIKLVELLIAGYWERVNYGNRAAQNKYTKEITALLPTINVYSFYGEINQTLQIFGLEVNADGEHFYVVETHSNKIGKPAYYFTILTY